VLNARSTRGPSKRADRDTVQNSQNEDRPALKAIVNNMGKPPQGSSPNAVLEDGVHFWESN